MCKAALYCIHTVLDVQDCSVLYTYCTGCAKLLCTVCILYWMYKTALYCIHTVLDVQNCPVLYIYCTGCTELLCTVYILCWMYRTALYCIHTVLDIQNCSTSQGVIALSTDAGLSACLKFNLAMAEIIWVTLLIQAV